MADRHLSRVFAALLAPETEDTRDAATHRPEQPLPSMNERVLMLLRATHGDGRDFTVEERAAARHRILDSMASSLAGEDAPSAAQRFLRRLAGVSAALRDVLFAAASGPTPGRRVALASAIALVLAILGWSLAWLHTVRTTETAIALWTDSEAKSGRAYACGGRTVGGFPFKVEVSCLAPKATIVFGRTTFTVDAKEVRTAASVLQPGVLVANIVGPVSIAEAGGPTAFLGNWAAARMVAHAAANRLEQFSLVLDLVQLQRAARTGMEALLTSERLELDVRRDPAGGQAVFAIAARIESGAIPIGGPIASQAFQADLRAVLYDPGQAAVKTMSAWVRDWQVAGGHLEVESAQVEQGEAVGRAAGQLHLNGRGRVEGDLRVTAAGPYAQLAESFLQGGPNGAAERERIAQGLVAGGRLHSRALVPEQSRKPRIDLPSGQGPMPPAHDAPLSAGSLETSIRLLDGGVYLGDRLVGFLPPLF